MTGGRHQYTAVSLSSGPAERELLQLRHRFTSAAIFCPVGDFADRSNCRNRSFEGKTKVVSLMSDLEMQTAGGEGVLRGHRCGFGSGARRM